ncbi:MAG: tetraacyldisaccharide 4'-kinase [Candidatus Omnitrophica bacterium]|nr:tetraacyldisaccharide 4'-kinase [Candidatus Omnitrophota bacterium]
MRAYLYNIITERPSGPFGLMLKAGLVFLSLFYLLAINLRLAFYGFGIFKGAQLKVPVISIGNLTWGGTGKTPLVEAICSYFKAQGKKVCLLTRGYGGDEDKALAENMPGVSVLAGKDRVKNARIKEQEAVPDIFVLDDGFQHLRIKRALDIVVVNGADPFGSGLLIPAGILREPVSHLFRADLIIITKTDLVSGDALARIKKVILKAKPGIEILESMHQPVSFYSNKSKEITLESIRGKNVCAVAGLGDNASFLKTLECLGVKIESSLLYMDHHDYKEYDFDDIISVCNHKKIDTVVTTQKDWVKLKRLVPDSCKLEFLVLRIKLKVKDEEGLFGRLSAVLPG